MKPPADLAMLAHGHRRRHLLRTARLNLAGGTTVAALSLLAGLVLAVLFSWLGLPAWLGGLAGPPVVLIVLVVADRRRFRRSFTSIAWTEDADAVRTAALVLAERGIEATVRIDDDEPPALRFRRRDERRVRDTLGLPKR